MTQACVAVGALRNLNVQSCTVVSEASHCSPRKQSSLLAFCRAFKCQKLCSSGEEIPGFPRLSQGALLRRLRPAVFLCPHQHWCEIDGDIVILTLKTNQYHGLTELGAFVWQEFTGEKTFEELTAAVPAELNADEETCRTDLASLLQSLAALIHRQWSEGLAGVA